MISTLTYGLTAAVLVSIGCYGLIAREHLLRQVLAFNVTGSGVFVLFGALGARSTEGPSDPVPQAMIITGIVVALAATAFAVALAGRLYERTGRTKLPD